MMLRMRWTAAGYLAAVCVTATVVYATNGSLSVHHAPVQAGIYSQRTAPGANGHRITTTAFPVRVGGEIYLCVVSEDDGYTNTGVVPLALAQSCDFSVSRSR